MALHCLVCFVMVEVLGSSPVNRAVVVAQLDDQLLPLGDDSGSNTQSAFFKDHLFASLNFL